MITTESLNKTYRSRLVLQNVSLDATAGCSILLGSNGAGKTTLLRILAGLARPDSGRVSIAGLELHHHPQRFRRMIGFFSHQTMLYRDLSPLQNLLFYSRLYRIRNPRHRIKGMLQRAGLSDRKDDPVRDLSHGMQQRLALLRATLHNPPVLLLDEPTRGLDTDALHFLNDLLQQALEEGKAILTATHHPENLACPVVQVLQLRNGRIINDADGKTMAGEVDHA